MLKELNWYSSLEFALQKFSYKNNRTGGTVGMSILSSQIGKFGKNYIAGVNLSSE